MIIFCKQSQMAAENFSSHLVILHKSALRHIGCTVQGGEIVRRCFRTADQCKLTVFMQQHLSGTKLSVVVVTHGVTVGTGVMDGDNIADVNLRQAPFNGKLIVIFAQTAGDIINVVQNGIFLTQHGDVVVGTAMISQNHSRVQQSCLWHLR